ncbi:uncharacterized protein LOC128993612 isoform X2 [Macrosteles quadrilineatus]|uniref:uncharacterized protein LOC128993612 isoform X2 n=1 Tax=Macrosteles quadrilineatus TaxID=74068 RepID=UPI0023E132F4|nr:uncharacterized protein LOC128993612 isoform X2 [Macrosteles quadrilineatus]
MSAAWKYGAVALTLVALLTLTDGSLLLHNRPQHSSAEQWLVLSSGLPPPPAPAGAASPDPALDLRRRRSPWRKRSTEGGGRLARLYTRSRRGNVQYEMHQMGPHARDRPYDVPQIECPPAEEDGMERFACPTPDRTGRYRCIDDHVLCDGFIDCPSGEDEDRQACMFYKTTKAHLDILADALLRWARGR